MRRIAIQSLAVPLMGIRPALTISYDSRAASLKRGPNTMMDGV